MRLADFILGNLKPILEEWDDFARSLSPGREMTQRALRDDAEGILRATAADMQVLQNRTQQANKSEGHGGAGGAECDELDHASALHGLGRSASGFDIGEVISEYRALRATVLRLWHRSLSQPDLADIDDITRFNESMDQSLATAVCSYTHRVDQARRMFLAILSHDLRNPLGCIRMAAFRVSRNTRDEESAESLSQIERHVQTITRLSDDLIDFASTSLGSAMPLTRGPVELELLCHEVIDGFRSAHADRTLNFRPEGDLTGNWDATRLKQVLSNLIGNALQHGSAKGPIELSAFAEGPTVVLRVNNEGDPIPRETMATIFDPMVRYTEPESVSRRPRGSVGLGMYIVREIVAAHGGSVEIASTAENGTTVTVRLARSCPVVDARQAESSAVVQRQ